MSDCSLSSSVLWVISYDAEREKVHYISITEMGGRDRYAYLAMFPGVRSETLADVSGIARSATQVIKLYTSPSFLWLV